MLRADVSMVTARHGCSRALMLRASERHACTAGEPLRVGASVSISSAGTGSLEPGLLGGGAAEGRLLFGGPVRVVLECRRHRT